MLLTDTSIPQMNNNKMEIDVYKKINPWIPMVIRNTPDSKIVHCFIPTYIESVNNQRGPQGSHLSAPGPVDPR